jgi:hypothetical protein
LKIQRIAPSGDDAGQLLIVPVSPVPSEKLRASVRV